ncbi:olfactory receptor 1f45-like [Ascaphus truei]|uniref:olfactory receptor 1f45-like n=1 Tax=Ascaphus truei TaxID=8439 RepID=UPI003F5ADD32
MNNGNQSSITEFLLLGFQSPNNLQILLFLSILVIYLVTIVGNVLIMLLVSSSHLLSSPMYFFLLHLSLCDVLTITNTVPNLLCAILAGGRIMSIAGCITQFYFFCTLTITESFLLMVMSYDRYLAICNPLRYNSIMDHRRCLQLIIFPWLSGFTLNLISVLPLSLLQFCGSKVIDHIYCDLAPLIEHSCSDTSVLELLVMVSTYPIGLFPFVFIIITYVCIFLTILGISSTTGRQKAFSTCSSHLAAVCMYYGPLLSKYIVPAGGQPWIVCKMFLDVPKQSSDSSAPVDQSL